jgi:MoaA/NifB/PqqE/SkfB family radical SAM enzyme
LFRQKLIRKEDQHYEAWLHWNVTSQCNFDCTYCFGKTPVSKADINILNIEKLINTLDKTGKVFRISFTGGEPFLIPNIIEACVELTEKHYVSFNTNLVLPAVKEFADRIKPDRVLNIHASLHVEELEKKRLLETYVSYFKLLADKGFNIYAEAVGWPGSDDKVENYQKLMAGYGIEFDYAPFVGKLDNSEYPDSYLVQDLEKYNLAKEQIRWFKQKGEVCNAAFNAGVVFSSGDIYPCFQIKEKMGNVYEGINFNSELTICPAKRCACPLNKYDEYLFSKACNNKK